MMTHPVLYINVIISLQKLCWLLYSVYQIHQLTSVIYVIFSDLGRLAQATNSSQSVGILSALEGQSQDGEAVSYTARCFLRSKNKDLAASITLGSVIYNAGIQGLYSFAQVTTTQILDTVRYSYAYCYERGGACHLFINICIAYLFL